MYCRDSDNKPIKSIRMCWNLFDNYSNLFTFLIDVRLYFMILTLRISLYRYPASHMFDQINCCIANFTITLTSECANSCGLSKIYLFKDFVTQDLLIIICHNRYVFHCLKFLFSAVLRLNPCYEGIPVIHSFLYYIYFR